MGWSNLLLQAGSRLAQLLDLGLEYRLGVLCVLLAFQYGFGESQGRMERDLRSPWALLGRGTCQVGLALL